MKRVLLTIAIALCCIIAGAQTKTTKVVTDSLTFMPDKVQIHTGVNANGLPKWWIELPTDTGVRKVYLSHSHVTANRLLALIERQDTQTGKYSYSVKFAEKKIENGKADLSSLKK